MADLLIRGISDPRVPRLLSEWRMRRRLTQTGLRVLRQAIKDDEVIEALLSIPEHFADLSITAASVAGGAGQAVTVQNASASITAGQALYTSSGQWALAKSNGTAAQATLTGIALSTGVSGQPLVAQTAGNINLGATLVVGTYYVASPNNAGGIAPMADLSSGNYVSLLGVATTTSNLQMGISNTGLVHG
jgi:hypothetical protein